MSRLSRRITWRVILIMTIFNVFIVGVVFISDLAVSEVESEMRAQYLMDGFYGKLCVMQSAVEIAARNSMDEFVDNLDSPEKVFDAMEHELRLNKDCVGFGIGFEPDYYPSQGRWFEPYVMFSDSTHVERKQIGSAQHDYFNQEWYVIGRGLAKGQGYMTDPYFDKDGGKCLLSTYVTPVFDRQGRQVAVYGIDLNLNWIKEDVAEQERKIKGLSLRENDRLHIDDYENFFFIQILDSKGRKIAGSKFFDEQALQTILKEDSIKFKKVKMGNATYYISMKGLNNTGWKVVVGQHRDFVLYFGYVLGMVIIVLMVIGCIVMFLFTSQGIRHAIKPLRSLSFSAHEVAQGHFDTPLPTFEYQDEIAHLRNSFDSMQHSLKQYVVELQESTAAKASIESELNVAQSIQMSMLPKIFPPFPDRDDIDLYAIQKPAKAVGGDIYDFFIRDEKLFFCIGDVSGTGVPASLVMAVTQTLFRSAELHIAEAGRIAEFMNRAVCQGNDNDMFVTLFIGKLDLQTGKLRYINAGHNAPYISASLLPVKSNVPLGVMRDWDFTEQEIELPENTMIFFYTDGLTEAENVRHEQFGEARMTAIIDAFHTSTPKELIDKMTDAVHEFVGDTEQSDDLTMLAIKVCRYGQPDCQR